MKQSTKATTIKLEGDLLADLERAKPDGMSVTGYVKDTLRKSLNAAKLRESAGQYVTMTESDREERALLKEWDAADLVSPPKASNKKKKSTS